MSTLWIMGLKEEYQEAKKLVLSTLDFSNYNRKINLFETTIRFIGGLLSAYEFDGDKELLRLAEDLANRSLIAFETGNGIPLNNFNPKTGELSADHGGKDSVILSQAGTLQLEFQYLSDITGNPIYADKDFIRPCFLQILIDDVTLGGLGDSYYEYLLKVWLATGDKRYQRYYETSAKLLIKHAVTHDGAKAYCPMTNIISSETVHRDTSFEHLSCFAGGMFGLGAVASGEYEDNQKDVYQTGRDVTDTCWMSYEATKTGLGPERVRGSDLKPVSSVYHQRPEVIESQFYFWRLTHEPIFRERGWAMVQSLEKFCKSESGGYFGLTNVDQVNLDGTSPPLDRQESYFLAETLKYLYLLFSDDNTIPLSQYVFNTEAHPISVRGYGRSDDQIMDEVPPGPWPLPFAPGNSHKYSDRNGDGRGTFGAFYKYLLAFYLVVMLVFGLPGVESKVTIRATGASFPNDIYQRLIKQFVSLYGIGVISAFEYIGNSSTAGLITQNNNTSFQWGGSDIAVNPALYNQSTLLALPAVAGAIAVAFNLPEISRLGNATQAASLRLSRTALPSIFDGSIKYWNDSLILQDNEPVVRDALSRITEPIRLVVRNPGSGTSANFIKFCRTLKGGFVEWTRVQGLNVISAKTNQAVGQIVGSIPYTITYMDRDELESSKSSNKSEPPLAAFVQNNRLQYVAPERTALLTALRNLGNDTIRSWNPFNGSLEALDSTAVDAYPITIISNYVIRQNNISSVTDVTAWTLRYMWWTLTSSEAEEIFNGTNFASLRNSEGSRLALEYIKNYTVQDQRLYNASICDQAAEGLNPCRHGKCENRLPFQPLEVKCVCEPGFWNDRFSDCREETPAFLSDPVTIVQLALAGVSVGVILGTLGLVMWHARHPKLRAISPMCCYVILVGCLCGAISIVAYAATPSNFSCRIRMFFPAAGFGSVFGMLLLKTYRIYTIFGYSRLKTSRGIRDHILVYLTLAITLVEILLCVVVIMIVEPRGKDSQENEDQSSFEGSTNIRNSFTVCAAGVGKEGVGVALEIIVYAYNAIILITALVLAIKTRGAFKRFAESKAIALPVLYAIPILNVQTNAVVNVVRSVLFFILSTGTPLILFAKRLGDVLAKQGPSRRLPRVNGMRPSEDRNETGLDKTSTDSGSDGNSGVREWPGDGRESSETDIVQHAYLQSFMFDVGICRNRFSAAWSGARLLMLPLHDILFFVDSMRSAETIVSMRISTTVISSPNWGDPDVSSLAAQSQHPIEDPSGVMPSTTASGFLESDLNGSESYQKRMVILLPEDDRSGWFVEFLNMDKLRIFKSVHHSVNAKETSASEIIGSIRRSLNSSQSPANPPTIGASRSGDLDPRSAHFRNSGVLRVGSGTFEGIMVNGKSTMLLEQGGSGKATPDGIHKVMVHDLKRLPKSSREPSSTGQGVSPLAVLSNPPVPPAIEEKALSSPGLLTVREVEASGSAAVKALAIVREREERKYLLDGDLLSMQNLGDARK
ncbi:hypothetical protein HDU67_007625 [Dinochytrium kinnereticum]|nr:hypothetical protein HDU67_007625 [Dinochytrium kinnereticum]